MLCECNRLQLQVHYSAFMNKVSPPTANFFDFLLFNFGSKHWYIPIIADLSGLQTVAFDLCIIHTIP